MLHIEGKETNKIQSVFKVKKLDFIGAELNANPYIYVY